jgi:hypothetical protein
MKKRTKFRIGSILAFIVVVLYANNISDIMTVAKYAGYAILITAPLLVLIRKYERKLNNVPEGLYVLLMVAALFFSRWLHSVSLAAEYIAGFIVCYVLIFRAFFVDEPDSKI